MRKVLLFSLIILLAMLTYDVLGQQVIYHRQVYTSLPDRLPVGARVQIEIQAEDALGQTGRSGATVLGYDFANPNVRPLSYFLHTPINPGEWQSWRYIVRFDKAPGNSYPFDQTMIEPGELR